MRLRSFLRDLRGARSITDACNATGLARGEVSMFERGHSIPRDDQAHAMTGFYGHPDGWYPPGFWNLVYPDIKRCPGCGLELDPGASRRRVYHGDACRGRFRRHGEVSPT